MTTLTQHLAKQVKKAFAGKLIQTSESWIGRPITGFGGEYLIGENGKGILYYTPIIDNIPQWNSQYSLDDQLMIWNLLEIRDDIFDTSMPPRSMTTLWLMWKWMRGNRDEFWVDTNDGNGSFDEITHQIRAARTELPPELAKYYALMLADIFHPDYADDWDVDGGEMMSEWGLPEAQNLINALSIHFRDVPEFQVARNNITNLINIIESGEND